MISKYGAAIAFSFSITYGLVFLMATLIANETVVMQPEKEVLGTIDIGPTIEEKPAQITPLPPKPIKQTQPPTREYSPDLPDIVGPTTNPTGPIPQDPIKTGPFVSPVPQFMVAPEYPPMALRRGIEGYAIVEYTITATGAVTDAIVIESYPKGTFDKAALKAISRSKFAPTGFNTSRESKKFTFSLE